MQIWPAIDLRGGKCVRLQQGDYARETVYHDSPAEMARHWCSLGAEYLHLVDLDGARDGRPSNLSAVREILAAVDVPCELGGGIRDEQAIRELLDLGLSRLVIGTLALKQPEWFKQMCRQFPERLVLGIDAANGQVATDGWLEVSETRAIDLAAQFQQESLAALVYTDIATDGMLQGPNTAAMREMHEAVRVPVVASGGVSSKEDVAALAQTGVAGCIIGKALYEGRLTLEDALDAATITSA